MHGGINGLQLMILLSLLSTSEHIWLRFLEIRNLDMSCCL